MNETLTLEFDGGSRGNPGPAGIGVVVRAADGTPLVTLGRFIGRATNNVAEYRALITALIEAEKLGATSILIRGDSELIVRQMTGVYKVKHPDMRVLYDEAQAILRRFKQSRFEHNLRHKNELADKLANLAMDRRVDVTEVDDSGMSRSPSRELAAKSAPTKFVCPRCACAIEVKKPSKLDASELNDFVCQCGETMRAEGMRVLKQL
jgi:ribonuclease HI